MYADKKANKIFYSNSLKNKFFSINHLIALIESSQKCSFNELQMKNQSNGQYVIANNLSMPISYKIMDNNLESSTWIDKNYILKGLKKSG